MIAYNLFHIYREVFIFIGRRSILCEIIIINKDRKQPDAKYSYNTLIKIHSSGA